MPDALLARDDSFLAVIDVQKLFLDKLPPEVSAPLVGRIAWLMGAARLMGIPVIAMAEDIPGNGPPVPEILAALPAPGRVFDKRVFGLAGQADITAAVAATGRRQAVLVGLETDVCVAQSALGLKAAGYRVAVAADGTGSPDHAAGLDRLRGASIAITTVKSVYYDWLRDLETLGRIKPQMPPPPEGLIL